MHTRSFILALALPACAYEPLGQCKTDGNCTTGLTCQSGVCVSCPGGVCGASKVIPAAGDSIVVYPVPYSGLSSLTVSFPANAVPAGTTVTLGTRSCANVPPSPGNVCVTAFDLAANGVTRFSRPVHVTGLNLTSLKPGTVLVVARIEGAAWVDVITAVVGGGGTFKTLHASGSLPGILLPGTYVLYQPAPGSPASLLVADFGIALIPDDGFGNAGLQIVSLYNDDGTPLATPTLSGLPVNGIDLDGAGLTPDGSEGVMVDGSNFVVFFSGVGSGVPVASTTTIDVTNYGGDGDAIAIMPNGDEAIVSADGNALVVISGIASGQPRLATSIPLSTLRDGLVVSNDGKVLLARGGSALTVFSIAPVTPGPGPLGGTLSHSFTHVVDFTVPLSAGEDGRDGMALDPADGSRAVIVGSSTSATIQLLTGLPGTAASPPTLHAVVPISGAAIAHAVAITPDGTKAVVGTETGLILFTGVDTGTLLQAGPPFNPSFFAANTTFTLSSAGVSTLGITLDGQFVVAMTASPAATNGALLTIPFQGSGFGAPVGQLTGIAVPANDQIMMH